MVNEIEEWFYTDYAYKIHPLPGISIDNSTMSMSLKVMKGISNLQEIFPKSKFSKHCHAS